MRADYTITSAKAKLQRCGMRFEGKQIVGQQPGIAGHGAIDFLKKRGYTPAFEIPRIVKDRTVAMAKTRKWV